MINNVQSVPLQKLFINLKNQYNWRNCVLIIKKNFIYSDLNVYLKTEVAWTQSSYSARICRSINTVVRAFRLAGSLHWGEGKTTLVHGKSCSCYENKLKYISLQINVWDQLLPMWNTNSFGFFSVIIRKTILYF